MTRAMSFSVLTAVIALGMQARAAKPNIVMVIADDLDNQTFQVAQQAGLLPNITTYIMERGTRFNR